MNQSKKRTEKYCKSCGRGLEPHIKGINDLYPTSPMAGLCDYCRSSYVEEKYPQAPGKKPVPQR